MQMQSSYSVRTPLRGCFWKNLFLCTILLLQEQQNSNEKESEKELKGNYCNFCLYTVLIEEVTKSLKQKTKASISSL